MLKWLGACLGAALFAIPAAGAAANVYVSEPSAGGTIRVTQQVQADGTQVALARTSNGTVRVTNRDVDPALSGDGLNCVGVATHEVDCDPGDRVAVTFGDG